MVVELDGYRGLGTPIKLSRTPGGARSRPPHFAEHTDDVLSQHGYTEDEITALKQAGVVHTQRRRG
jgi:formyl-CoA transferase